MKYVIMILTFLASVHCCHASPAATRSWVSNYVSRTTSELISGAVATRTNDVAYIKIGNGSIKIEDASVYALRATNATYIAVAQGVTNGMYFVWDGASHSYTNYTQTITATKTNFVWRGVQSVDAVFSNYFSVVGWKLQPSVAREVVK